VTNISPTVKLNKQTINTLVYFLVTLKVMKSNRSQI